MRKKRSTRYYNPKEKFKEKTEERNRTVKNDIDITIGYHANSSKPNSKLSKSKNFVQHYLKIIKNEISYAVDDADVSVDSDDSGEIKIVRKSCSSKGNNRKIEIESQESEGIIYPKDVWFLLANFIKPEDILLFALICKNSYYVTQTISFWKKIQKNYCANDNLFSKSNKHCKDQSFYRTSVIRSLYCVYRPFKKRIERLNYNPDILKGKKCILQWYDNKGKDWFYYFKFNKSSSDDILENPEENCIILQMKSSAFVALKCVIGMTLTTVNKNLTKGFREYRLKLGFGSQVKSDKCKIKDEIVCIINPVRDIKVLNWWHPLYPFSGKFDFSDSEKTCYEIEENYDWFNC